MTDLTSSTSVPAIIIFGTDEKGRPHASYFEQTDLTAAEKAASVMGMRSLITSSEDERALATELPRGRLFVSGRAFVPFAGAGVYRRLTAAVRAKASANTTKACNNSANQSDNLSGAQPATTTIAEPVGAFETPGAVSVPPAAETEPAAGFWAANRPLPPEPTIKRPRRGQNTLESAQIAPTGATPADPGQATACPDSGDQLGDPSASQSDRQGDGQGRQNPNSRAIEIGTVMLATTTGPGDGWWEAVVTEIDNDVLVLRWRDWPDEPAFSRRRSELALLHPGRAAEDQQANRSA